MNSHMLVPESLRRAIQASQVTHTILNYAHLYPVISDFVPREQIVCETHDIISYAHAVRRAGPVSLTEKIDEFSDLRQFPQIVAISADEHREMESACPASAVFWRLPPYIPERPAESGGAHLPAADLWYEKFGVPDAIAQATPDMLATYYTRPDLQQAFGLGSERGRAAFFRWWVYIGQFESERQLELTPAQFRWLLHPLEEGGESSALTGHLRLILSWRADLRAAFINDAAVDVEGLAAWEKLHASRELGFSSQDLLEMSERYSAPDALRAAQVSSALDAVVRAGPSEIRGAFPEVRALFQRIAEVEAIDLVLVGSGHPANVTSFLWFINQVFLPHIAPSGRNLFVAGSVCRQLPRDSHRNIFLLGRCERIEPILSASRACPLPVIAGSGSPIKTIPAMAVNGAVTVTDRIEQAFRLSAYGIPSFANPKAFADDLNRLLTDDDWRADRVQRSRRYVEDTLRMEDYVEFWRKRIDGPPARYKAPPADAPVAITEDVRLRRNDPPPATSERDSPIPINRKLKSKMRKH
jgi:hypothetical protein